VVVDIPGLMNTQHVEAYDIQDDGNPVHEYIVGRAIGLYLNELGWEDEFNYYYYTIQQGARHEDLCDHVWDLGDETISKVTYTHFWDADKGPDDPVDAVDVWSDEDNAWQKAQILWGMALGEYANGDKETAYHFLGHVAHLLQDMSVPAHAHEDTHPDWDDDFFEVWMNTNYELSPEEEEYLEEAGPVSTQGWGRPLYFLFYTMNQIGDYFPSNDCNGDDIDKVEYGGWMGGVGGVYEQLGMNSITWPKYLNDIYDDPWTPNITALKVIRQYSYLYSIRATAGLFQLFAEITSQSIPLTVVIEEIKELKSHGDTPDYFVAIKINDFWFRNEGSQVVDKEHIHPHWAFGRDVGFTGQVPIVIRLWDEDEDPNPDDHSDIDPVKGRGDDLDIFVDLDTGAITGDVTGTCGVTYSSKGNRGYESSQIWFKIIKPNHGPEPDAGPDQTVYEGELMTLSGTFTDPNEGDTHSATWDWGDGSDSSGTVSDGTVTGSHTYNHQGVYTVTMTVTDNRGSVGTDTMKVTVINTVSYYNDHRYKLFATPKTWAKAKEHCVEQGGHLVTISDDDENEFVRNLADSNTIWIGLTDEVSENNWRWVTDEPYEPDIYNNWNYDQPDNDGGQNYVEMDGNGKWWDSGGPKDHYMTRYFVCEWEEHGGVRYNGHEYRLFTTPKTWTNATRDCEARGGHLVTITSISEGEFVRDFARSHEIWIGLTDKEWEGDWEWVTGEPYTRGNWAPNRPIPFKGDDYVYMDSMGRWWDDGGPSNPDLTHYYVCEWEEHGGSLYNNHEYKLIREPKTWSEAKAYCEAIGGHLVTIRDSDENNFVRNLADVLGTPKPIWLGLTDEEYEGDWKWITGENYDYNNWNIDADEPDDANGQDYAMSHNGKWYDDGGPSKPSTALYFVCEWEKHGGSMYNNHQYKLIKEEKTWSEAKAYCEARGGHLVTISNIEENNFVSNIAGSNIIWIGLTDEETENDWEWITGENYGFENWYIPPNDAGEGEDYVLMFHNGYWNDNGGPRAPDLAFYFVCEWPDDKYCVWVDDDFNPSTRGWGVTRFNEIQDGVDAVDVDGTVIVNSGTYYENVVIDKTLTLKGQNKDTTIIEGLGSGYGIYSDSVPCVTIKNLKIQGFQIGIYLDHSNGSTVAKNTVSVPSGYDSYGIRLNQSDGSTISGNEVEGGEMGIYLWNSGGCTVTGNEISVSYYGILLYYSGGNTLRENEMADNRYNFGVYGDGLQDYIQDINISNTVDGKPIYYLKDLHHLEISPSTGYGDAGYLGIVNSDHITVKDLTLSNNGQGILLAHTSHSTIQNVDVSGNKNGICLDHSNSNTISENTVSDNKYVIYLWNSNSNTIFHNNFIDNTNRVYKNKYSSSNIWDDGAGKGNYWSDYTGLDDGSNGRVRGDGIGDNDLPHPYFNIGAVSYWNLDENGGIEASDSVGSNDGTIDISSGPTWTSGQIGSALSFDGVDDYVQISSPSDLPLGSSARTLEAWIYPTGGQGTHRHIAGYGTNSQRKLFDIKIDNDNSFALVGWGEPEGYDIISGSPSITLNNWYHVAATYDGNFIVKLFVNGNLVKTGTLPYPYDTTLSGNGFTIGTNNNAKTNWPFEGLIDEVAIYNRALTVDEIQGHYNSGLAGMPISAFMGDYYPLTNPKNSVHNIDTDEYFDTINEAINNANPGDSIEVGSGKYLEYVVIDKPLTLIGEDNENTVIKGTGAGNGIYLSGQSDVTIQNFKITGFNNGIVLLHSNNNIIINNNLRGNSIHGLHSHNSDSNLICDNIASTNNRGIHLGYSEDNILSANKISNNNYQGIALVYSNYNSVTTNNVSNNTAGIWLSSSNSNTIKDNIAINNNNGIFLVSYSSYNNIEGNTAFGNYFQGISIDQSDYNIINNNIASNNNDRGIVLRESNCNTISNNTVSKNSNMGISLFSYSNNNIISGNTASSNNHGIHLDFSSINEINENIFVDNNDVGIYLIFSSHNNIITSNTVSNNGGVGIRTLQSNFITISENTVLNNRAHGILLRSSTNCIISDNTASSNNYAGILLDDTYGILVTDNIGSSNNWSGIYPWETYSSTISGNILENNIWEGITVWYSSDNIIFENTISNNGYGFWMEESNNNDIFHNNVIDNTIQLYNFQSTNTWHNNKGEGNYWSDYTGLDDGSNGRVAGDGVGDTKIPHPYIDIGAVSYWKLDEESGASASDLVGSNDGTLEPSGPVWTTGQIGGALSFDGVDDYVVLPSIPSMNDWSFSIWFKLSQTWDSSSTGVMMIYGAQGNNPDVYLQFSSENNGKLRFRTWDPTDNLLTTTNSWQADTWYFVTITYSNSEPQKKIYVNGVLENSISASAVHTGGTDVHIIGAYDKPSFPYFFKGIIDEAAIWNRALSSTEIQQHYNDGLAGIEITPDDSTAGLWHLDEGSSNTATDSSNNNNDGTLMPSGPIWTTGQVEGALSFDGVDDYVDCGNNPSLNFGLGVSFTYEAWIYAKSTTGKWRGIIYHDERGASQGHLGISSGGYLAGGSGDGSSWQTHVTSYNVPSNVWVHVVMSLDRNTDTLTFYTNGAEIGSYSHPYIPSAPTRSLVIGLGAQTYGSEYFNGFIDEVAIYNRALTADEIQEHYNIGLAGLPINVFMGDYYPLTSPKNSVHNIDTDEYFDTINEAINNANPYDAIFVGFGRYFENVVIDKPLTLIGEDIEKTVIHGTGSGRGIYINGQSDVTIQNLNITGFHYGIHIRYSSSITVSSNTILDNNYGIVLTISENTAITENTVSLSDLWGIYLSSSSGNTVAENTVTGGQYGIQLDNSGDNTLIGNTFTEVANRGITLSSSGGNTVTGNMVTGSQYGINIGHSEGLTVTFNTVIDSGIDLYYSGDSTLIGNTVTEANIRLYSSGGCTLTENTVMTTDGSYGIHIYYSNGSTFVRNTVTGSYFGIIVAYSNSSMVTENTITIFGYGIHMRYSDDGTVTGNAVTGGYYGIRLDDSGGITVTENTVTGTINGIALAYSNGCTVTDNTILDNEYSGICLEYSDNNSISGNLVMGNSNVGFYLVDSNDNSIYYNNIIDNTYQLHNHESTNTWHNGAGEGNYWSDYTGLDDGSHGRVTRDGIGDTDLPHPYVDTKAISYWKFDEGSGTTTYDFISNNDGTLYEATWTTGQVETAISFDGVDDYVDLTGSSLNNIPDWTFSAWIYPRNLNHGIIYSEGIPQMTFQLRPRPDGSLYLAVWNLNRPDGNWMTFSTPSGVLTVNTWNYIAVTLENGDVDSGDLVVYVNGNSYTGIMQRQYNPNTKYAAFGRNVGSLHGGTQGISPFNGIIDEVVIYHQVLSATEIQQLYDYGLAGYPVSMSMGVDEYPLMVPVGFVYNVDKKIIYNSIQESVNDADSGNTIKIGRGIYHENVVVDKSLTLIGDREKTILQGSGSGTGIYLNGISGVTIENLQITGFSSGIKLDYSSNNYIINNKIQDNEEGILLTNSHDNTIVGNILSENDEPGIIQYKFGIKLVSSNFCTISNNIASNNGYGGIGIYYSDDVTISDNILIGNKDGIWVTTSNRIHVSGNNASSNIHGIQLQYSDNSEISGNIILNNEEHGLSLNYYNNGVISENTISSTVLHYGINLRNSLGSTIFDNEISNNIRGINLVYSNEITINQNILTGGNHGIWMEYSENNNIIQNQVSENLYGLYAQNSPHNIIDFNTFSNNGRHGINLGYCEFTIISNNTISDNGQYGIHLGYSHESLIRDNKVSNHGWSGIDLYFTFTSTIRDNIISYSANSGIILRISEDNTIKYNYISNNEYGIYLSESNFNFIFDNIYNFNNHGIYLFHSDINFINENTLSFNFFAVKDPFSNNNIISNNIITNNVYGIYIEDSQNNTITNNSISENDHGLYLDENSTDNEIYYNNFIENDVQAQDYGSNTWDDGTGSGNFWSDYTGEDSDGDGIGDTSHVYDNAPIIEPPSNAPPVVKISGPYEVYESIEITFDASDSIDYNDDDILHFRWDFDGDGILDTDWSTDPTATFCWYDDFSGTAVVEVTDGEFIVKKETTVTVNNVAPIITSWEGPIYPVDLNVPIEMTGTFTDPGTSDTHTATIDWGDGTRTEAIISQNTISGTHSYSTIGVYKVTVTITDDDLGTASRDFRYIAIYDSTEGHVTGGGWIDSPEGAYYPDPTLSGKASFGFVAKYKKGTTEPIGKTEFQFHAAGMNFHSSNYEWLVVAGSKAMFKGTGTINGEGEYKFILTAVDGDLKGKDGGPDKFRIKIWVEDEETGEEIIIYDNMLGAEVDEELDETTELGGGAIVIHKG
jgi:parallel beta-helix repeat protein